MKNSDLINYCIQNSIPFVNYRLPSENDITTLAGGCFVSDPEERKHDIRFVIAPFDTFSEKTRYYIPDMILAGGSGFLMHCLGHYTR